MKKLAFLFAAVVAVSFASCGPTEQKTDDQAGQESTELTDPEAGCEEKDCTKCDTCTCEPCPGDSCQAEPAAETPCDPA